MALPAPAAPFVAPASGPIDQRLSQLAAAVSRKADQTTQPVYNSVILIAPNGAPWRVAVSDTGVLSVTAMAR
jgi:hypothetical protein